MHFIVVDDRGRLIAGACSSPDVAGLVALLEDEPAFVRSLEGAVPREQSRASALPRGWSVVDGDDVVNGTTTFAESDTTAPDDADARAGGAAAPALQPLETDEVG
jgi:hypothetical protein